MCDNQGDKYLFLQHTVHFKTVSSPIVADVGCIHTFLRNYCSSADLPETPWAKTL